MRLPQPRREFGDASGRLYSDTLQHVDEVGVRIDVVQPESDDEALHDPDVLRAELGPTKIPVFPAERNGAQRALQVIRVEGHVRIGEKYRKALTPRARISERLGKRIARQEPLTFELSIDPLEELFDNRLAVSQPMQPLGLAAEATLANFGLDGIEAFDLGQGVRHTLGFNGLRLKKLSARVRLIPSSG